MTAAVDQTAVGPPPIPDHFVAEIVQVIQSKQEAADGVRVRELVEREWARCHDARVRTFVPVLVRRAVIGQVSAARDIG